MPVQRWITTSSVEQVPALRRGVVAFAQRHGMASQLTPDLAIAVSEILTNVALHGDPGDLLTVEVDVEDDVVVVVRGAGVGLSPRANGPAARTGLILVASLARSVRVGPADGGGREVSLTFPRSVAACGAEGPGGRASGARAAVHDQRPAPVG